MHWSARNANIAVLWKGKKDKLNLENHRGIFLISKLRTILMKLIYNSCYPNIEDNMSDSNIGSRKGEGI